MLYRNLLYVSPLSALCYCTTFVFLKDFIYLRKMGVGEGDKTRAGERQREIMSSRLHAVCGALCRA